MSSDGLWDVQRGVYAVLAAHAPLTAQLADGAAGILDTVPANTPLPYLLIGETAGAPFDMMNGSGFSATLALHAYSQSGGMQEVKTIMSAVYDALHLAAFDVPGRTLLLCSCAGAEAALDADGVTRHGVQHFEIITI